MKDAQRSYEETSDEKYTPIIAQNKVYQMAMKILINSLYGAISSEYFRYFMMDIAEGITATGRLMVKYIEKCNNELISKRTEIKRDYVCAIDTDSNYVSLHIWVEQILKGRDVSDNERVDLIDAICKREIEPNIEKSYNKLSDYMNAVENKMSMKREVISLRAAWRAKKNYIMLVHDNEGIRYKTPKLKETGIETVRSTNPELTTNALRECLLMLLHERPQEELSKKVKEFREVFMSAPLEQISAPIGVNSLNKYKNDDNTPTYNCPWHTKAAIIYNLLLEKYGLSQYEKIEDKTKVRIVQLRTPNISGNDKIAFLDVIPPELGLENYINRGLMFEKLFVNPLNSFAHLEGKTAVKSPSLGFIGDGDVVKSKAKRKPMPKPKQSKSLF